MSRLVEDMLLLGSTPEGRHALRDLPTLVAGAALADLAHLDRVDAPGRTVTVLDPTPTDHPVLDDLLGRMVATRRPRAPWRWVFDSARPLTDATRTHLVQTGLLGRQEDVVLGMLPRTRHPVVDLEAQQRLVEEVRAVVLADEHHADGASPQAAHTIMLCSLLATAFHSRRTAAALFPELDARELRTRLRSISTPHWAVAGTAHAVRLANAARP
ncbi:MAG: GPP34 family phosphoprotein [Mobilicoccus sp.]|nr:GPP34 family phosphoprotein [Mobilicoccus sp.]